MTHGEQTRAGRLADAASAILAMGLLLAGAAVAVFFAVTIFFSPGPVHGQAQAVPTPTPTPTPTQTPTPERREGYEERLAARIARYKAARAAAAEASGEPASGLIFGLASSIPRNGSDAFTVSADGLDTDPGYQYSFLLTTGGSGGIGFNSGCSYRSEAVTVPKGNSSWTASLTLHACISGTYTLTARLFEYSIDEEEEYILETDTERVTVTGTPDPTDTPTPRPKPTDTPTPRPKPTDTPTPRPAPTDTPTPVPPTPTPTPIPPTPTPTPIPPPAPTNLRANGHSDTYSTTAKSDIVTLRWESVLGITRYEVRYTEELCLDLTTPRTDFSSENIAFDVVCTPVNSWKTHTVDVVLCPKQCTIEQPLEFTRPTLSPGAEAHNGIYEETGPSIVRSIANPLYRVQVRAVRNRERSGWSDFVLVFPTPTVTSTLYPGIVATSPLPVFGSPGTSDYRYTICTDTITSAVPWDPATGKSVEDTIEECGGHH